MTKPMKAARTVEVEVLPPVAPSTDAVVPAVPGRAWKRKKLEAAPLAVHGTWDSARRWLGHAKYLQEAALYCQVMLGFELLAIRDAAGETRGRPSKGEISPRRGLISGIAEQKSTAWTFAEIAEKETGLGRSSIFKFIAMAEAAASRLKGLPALKNFDPTTTALGLLPDAQKHALSAAVKKMTDGLTQQDFLVELGLAKAPQGSGATGGARTPKNADGAPPTLAEKADAERERVRRYFDNVRKVLHVIGDGFVLLDDTEIMQQEDFLEAHLKARRLYRKPLPGNRDPESIQALLPTL